MNIFAGYRGYRFSKKHDIPMIIYKEWLKAKWIADLKVLTWIILMSPFLAFWLTGLFIKLTGHAIYATHRLFPDWMFLSKKLRDKQVYAAQVARTFMK